MYFIPRKLLGAIPLGIWLAVRAWEHPVMWCPGQPQSLGVLLSGCGRERTRVSRSQPALGSDLCLAFHWLCVTLAKLRHCPEPHLPKGQRAVWSCLGLPKVAMLMTLTLGCLPQTGPVAPG